MDVKEATQKAKTYLADLFADEAITNVGLEEVVFDDSAGEWKITIGFSRPWDHKNSLTAAIADSRLGRSYKVIRINDAEGTVGSLTDRLLAPKND